MEFLNYHHLRYFWAVAGKAASPKPQPNSTSRSPPSARRFKRSKGAGRKTFPSRGPQSPAD